MSENSDQGTDGRFIAGNNANPSGSNGDRHKGFKPYKARLMDWAIMPLGELKALMADKREMDKMSVIDAACVRQLAGACVGDETIKQRETMLDRIEGKPTATLNLQGKIGIDHDATVSAREFISSQLTGIAARLGAGIDTGQADTGTDIEPTV